MIKQAAEYKPLIMKIYAIAYQHVNLTDKFIDTMILWFSIYVLKCLQINLL